MERAIISIFSIEDKFVVALGDCDDDMRKEIESIVSDSTLVGKIFQENSIVTGNPIRIIKENTYWRG